MERVKHRNNGTMRILHVIGKMGRGGAESMIMNLYRQIDKSNLILWYIQQRRVHMMRKSEKWGEGYIMYQGLMGLIL